MTGYVGLDVTLCLFLQLGRATYCVLRVLVCTVYWFKECGLYTERCLGLSDYGVGQSENSHHQTGVLSQKGNANECGSWKFEVASSGYHAPSSTSLNCFVCYIAISDLPTQINITSVKLTQFSFTLTQ